MFGKRSGPPSGPRRRRRPRRFPRRKVCRFCVDKTLYIDYKNYRLLRDFLSEPGEDYSPAHQRNLCQAPAHADDGD